MKSSPKVYIFDLDGTLFYLPIDWEQLFAEFRTIMHVDTVRPLVDTISKLDQKTRREVFDKWDSAELAVAENITPCEEGMQLYRDAEAEGKQKALVTLQGKRIVKFLVKRFHLEFDVIITREDSLSRAEQLRIGLKKLNASAEHALFVGNAENDAIAAKKTGCAFHIVTDLK